jgi:serine/threonine protein kinase
MPTPNIKQLGRYRIVSELGRGAMGVVYKAHDPVLDRTVALKTIMLGDDVQEREEFQSRFFQEAKAAGRLNHPALITIYDFGEEGSLAYMAMELLDGTELSKRMAQGALPVHEAISIAEQVAEGLAFAHDNGVIHRDIKPGNITLLPHGRVKIMDFGIARLKTSDLKTQLGVRLGTPKYMSPEQSSGATIDHRTDIFSLGIVLYEMLTGARLF